MKKYFAIKGSTNDFIKVSTGYEKGGISVWTGKDSKRGYYVYVTPVQRDNRFESQTLFDGYKQLLKEVGRAGKKAEAEAENMALNVAIPIVNRIAQEKGWEIEGD